MTEPLDHYQALGIAPTASTEEIRQAFKALSQKMHPDKGGSEEAYRLVAKANQVLSDPQSRVIYDQGLRQGINPKEFKTVLGRVINATLPKVLGRLTAHGGIFDQAVQFELATQKSTIANEKQQVLTAQKIITKQLKSIKSGQDTHFAQALIREGEKINAALTAISISLAVIKFLSEDTSHMVCEDEAVQMRSFMGFSQSNTGSTNW